MVSLPGQALAAQTLSIKGREERVKEMGVMSSSVHSPGDHVEESLPLPSGRGCCVVDRVVGSCVVWVMCWVVEACRFPRVVDVETSPRSHLTDCFKLSSYESTTF